jgi:sugar-specific transcriptional regulator TrmB
MDSAHIEEVMTGLGFSLYESKAYVALVAGNPLTGYELSGRSGIPRSKVYECIERLKRKGLVFPVEGNPVRYVPVPPEELVRRLSREFGSSLERLGQLLKEERRDDQAEYIFNIGGYEEIVGKAREMIRDAGAELDLALWGPEIEHLREDLTEICRQGVKVRLLTFNGETLPGVEAYRHRPISTEEFSGRWITVVRDRSEALTGQCSGEGGAVAAWTRNRSLVFVSLKYIEHEILRIRERK